MIHNNFRSYQVAVQVFQEASNTLCPLRLVFAYSDEARRGAEADHGPAGKGRPRHAAVPRQPPLDGRNDAGLSRRAEEARLSRRPIVAGPGNGPTVPAPAGWFSETGRVTGALKPRLDKSVAPAPPGPFAVKPAPVE